MSIGSDEASVVVVGDGRCSVRHRGDAAVYLGGEDVSSDDGFQLDPGESIGVRLRAETLYAVAASGTQVLHVLKASA